MSADGELYVGEDCRDAFADELDKVFGKDNWHFDLSEFYDCWGLESFPKEVTVNIKDNETDEKIGEAKITSEFRVEEGIERRYIQPYPDSIKIKKLGVKK